MPKVFLCYRREDSSHQADRICDQLAERFGKDELFMDVDSTTPGCDFRRVVAEKVEVCDVLLAIIGERWLTVTEPSGRRRIENPNDYVRYEIETALRCKIPVIPVLVDKATIPEPGDLPDSMQNLCFHQATPIRRNPDFHTDMERLVDAIIKVAGGDPVSSVSLPKPRINAPRGPAVDKSKVLESLGVDTRARLETALKQAPGAKTAAPKPARVQSASHIVRLGILKSGNATYVNDIERELLKSLEWRLARQRGQLTWSEDCVEWGEEDQWASTVGRLLQRSGPEGFRFLIGIGTQAAVALRDTIGAEFGNVPTLLLGVTYPRITGLVDSEHYRCESRQVACIRYGCGVDAVASLLHHRIFPGRQLCFVFQAGVPQDELAFEELRTTRLAHDGTLSLLRLEGPLEADDLANRETVYFSWYTFTRLFHKKEFSILTDRMSVSIMEDNVRDGVAIAGVGTDHIWIGDHGAELIAEHDVAPPNGKPNWGTLGVMVSPLVYWLNRRLAKKHHIEFSPAALRGADKLYD